MTQTTVALLGVAHVHAEGYAAWLTRQPDVDVLGFVEDDPVLAAGFAASTGLRRLPLQELPERNPRGVVVCSETVHHRAYVDAAAQAGAHVLCEKPIATTVADAQAMLDACTRAGVAFHTAFPVRYSPAAQTLRAQLRAGELGAVLAYSGVNHSVAPDHERAWFSDPALSGGGAGMDHIIHLADLLLHFGERVEGVRAQLRAVPEWTVPGHTSGRHWAGFGPDLNAAMLRDFMGVCQGRAAALLAGGHDGLEALRVVLAAYDASRSGHPVTLA
jgi:predicted dehydrogenase